MSNQKITESVLFKAVLVLVSLGALIWGLKIFYHLPEFIDRTPHQYHERNPESSLSVTPGTKNVYIPQKEKPKRAPIYFDTQVK